MRTCKKCGIDKELNTDNFRQGLGRNKKTLYFKHTCRECEKIQSKRWGEENREHRRQYTKNFLQDNPEYKKEYKKKNREKIRQYNREYESRTHVKLKKRISDAIRKRLKQIGGKKTLETLSILPYSIDELKAHLENQFEPWMSWDNWGVYNSETWDDDDSSTWTWQIDHIKPMAKHSYSCETDVGFQKAWKLENLRPLRSKDNVISGARVRRVHKPV